MADWSNPQLTSTYTNFLTEVKNRDVDLALQFDGTTSTNLTTGTIRWSSSANRWQKWNGTTWAELTGTYALTGLSTTGAASIGTTLGVSGVTTLSGGGTSTTAAIDNNSTNIATTAYVVGQASGTAPVMNGTATVGTSLRYARQDHVHPSDTTRAPLASPTFTGTVTIPSGASISGYAPLASPTFTGTPATVTAAIGTNTTQIASTAYVKSEIGNSTAASAVNLTGTSTASINSSALATGTANATTFLCGDRSWQVVSTTPTTAQVLTATAGSTGGDVGTYACMRGSVPAATNLVSLNGTIAGSSLSFAPTTTTTVAAPTGSGTWKCMGRYDNNTGSTQTITTLWLRVA
jgi:hypothetical protein